MRKFPSCLELPKFPCGFWLLFLLHSILISEGLRAIHLLDINSRFHQTLFFAGCGRVGGVGIADWLGTMLRAGRSVCDCAFKPRSIVWKVLEEPCVCDSFHLGDQTHSECTEQNGGIKFLSRWTSQRSKLVIPGSSIPSVLSTARFTSLHMSCLLGKCANDSSRFTNLASLLIYNIMSGLSNVQIHLCLFHNTPRSRTITFSFIFV